MEKLLPLATTPPIGNTLNVNLKNSTLIYPMGYNLKWKPSFDILKKITEIRLTFYINH
jgi:hypothetical protein